MKQAICLLIFALVFTFTNNAYAEESPTCIFMKFSNDTRYKNINIADELSDLVLSKIISEGKFNLKETKPIDTDMETMLYDEKARELSHLQTSINRGNFNKLFESGSFDSQHAISIATAKLGQIISPSITSSIGKQHGAEYLIQGTIINMGNGGTDIVISNSTFYFYHKQSGVGIETDLRIIKASTGEVIWQKKVLGEDYKSLTQVGRVMVGSAKLTSDMYTKAVEEAAQKIADALIKDLEAGVLFTK